MLGVRLHTLGTTDAFIAFDLDNAETSVGVTRLAPKILRDGAELLARSTTYAFASFGLRLGGASAGINTAPEGRDAAVSAFIAEVRPLVQARRWFTRPGLGLGTADLARLRPGDAAPASWSDDDLDLNSRGALAAATAVVGELASTKVATMGTGSAVDAAADAARTLGATVVAGADDQTGAEVILVAGKAGVLDHHVAATVRARVVVGLTPVPVTARAFAVLCQAGTVYVPDFLSTAAPLLGAFDPEGGDPVERVASATAELSGEGTGLWLASARRAEAFLSGWQDTLPFGRPLA